MHAPPRPLIIVDECLPAELFRSFLLDRGYRVATVREAFPSGSPDPAILAIAEIESAVILSTDQDWETLLRQVTGHKGRVGRAGRIVFRCKHQQAFPRLVQLIDFLEREYAESVAEGRRFLVRVTETRVTVDR